MKAMKMLTKEDLKPIEEQESHPGERIHLWIQALGKDEVIQLHSDDIRALSDYVDLLQIKLMWTCTEEARALMIKLEKENAELKAEISKLRLDLGWLNTMPT